MPTASVPPPSAEVLPAERERDPDGPLRAVAWLVVAFALSQILLFAFGRDQGIYAVLGRGVLDGRMPYRELWDFKPPGIFLIYAASFAVFGNSMIAPRLVECLCLFAVVLGCRRLGGTLLGSRTAGLVGGALAALLHAQLEFWHTAQPETFAGALTMGALVLTTSDVSRHRRFATALWVGVCFGACFVLKPTLAAPALVCASYMALHPPPPATGWSCRIVPFVGVALGASLPIGGVVAWFVARGAWPELAWTLGEFAPGYTQLGWVGRTAWGLYAYGTFELFGTFSSLLTGGLLLALILERQHREVRRGAGWLLAVVLSQLIGIALQGKFFQYHYAASLPFLAPLAGAGIYRAYRRFCVGSVLGGVALGALLVALSIARLPVRDVPLGFWARSALRLRFLVTGGRSIGREELERELYRAADYDLASDRAVASELVRLLPPDRALFVWGFEPALYWLSERRPASRYVYDVPQRATWQAARARAVLLQELAADPPGVIVVQHGDVFPFVTGNTLGSGDALRDFPELAQLLARDYRFERRVDDFELHVRRGDAPTAPGP